MNSIIDVYHLIIDNLASFPTYIGYGVIMGLGLAVLTNLMSIPVFLRHLFFRVEEKTTIL
jgi:hypothetical protein